MTDNPVLTKEEAAYFSSKGEKAIAEPTTPEPEAQPEPVAREAPEPEPAPEPETGDEPSQPDNRTVPLAALHESRAKERAEREARVAAEKKYADDMARMEARLQAIQSAFQPPPVQPQPQPVPDVQADPLAYVLHAGKTAEQVQQEFHEYRQQQAAIQQEQQVRGWAASQESQFQAEAPDYQDAIDHLKQSRAQELALMGLPETAIPAQLAQEADALLVQAIQTKQNPAKLAYELAKKRGFTGKAPPAADPEPAAEEKIETIERGQRLGARLPPNGASPVGVTNASLLAMSEKEFAAWLEKATPAQKRQHMGA